ncbi:hypothetical protein niasHT_019798 [Heterodera trifolii]|uniref:SAM domain-containing protein n=1 Tax=Heterodera trifolii TaxID=157864 RepID=A0ABD2LEI4_9BILA
METLSTKSDETTEIGETSLNSRQMRIGGGFWNEWRTVGNDKSDKVSDDEGEQKGHGFSSSSSSVSGSAAHIAAHCPTIGPNSEQNYRNQIPSVPIGTLDDNNDNDANVPIPADLSEDSLPVFRQTASSSSPSSSSSSNGITSSPKSNSSALPESDGQVPSSNLDSSASSAELSLLALSQNGQKNLRFFIEAIEKSKLATPISLEDKLKVLDWMGNSAEGNEISGGHEEKSPSPSMSASCSDFPESHERLQSRQTTRDSLSLQVAALSRQVALQREKIRDLEESLGNGTNGKQYQHQQGTAEGGGGRQQQIGEQLDELRHKFLALERERTEGERNLQHNETEQRDAKIGELEQLQIAVQRLMADNEQKNSLIKTLHNALEEQQRRLLSASLLQQQNEVSVHQLDINEQIRRILLTQDDLSLDGSDHSMMAHSSSFPAGLCAQSFRSASPRRTPQPFPPSSGPTSARQQCFPVSTSFSSSLSALVPPPPLWRVSSPPPPSIPPHQLASEKLPQEHPPQAEQPSTSSSGRAATSPLARQLAAELDELRQSAEMGVLLRQPYSSASLPRSIHSKANSLGVCAATRLRHAVESDDELASSARGSVPNSEALNGHSPPNAKHLKRGRRARSTLRSFLGRFAHRGNSLQDVRPSQRLSPSLLPPGIPSSSSCASIRPPLCHFVDWDRALCSRWLTEVGFGDVFVGAVRSGRHLLSMVETEFETELGIRSALQRKRLKSMLDRIERNVETEAADKMDTNLVMLWLDHIGLPQLRDIFAENRIDGNLLLVLSVNDLIELGIHSALNHASLARAIQFLRSVDFHLHRLEKHFNSESLARCPIPAEVERWSHCCTVEWLRSEDLEEFTPNLAFSGLHGALMVCEPTFTVESLAEMLQIPPTKTLIRRHLTTQFNALLGQQIVGNKRDTVAQPTVTHLTPGLRIRLAKRGFSLGRKKSKSDIFVEPEVRICPEERMEVNGTEGGEMSEV